MKRKYANTRRKKALIWLLVLLLSALLYYFASGYCLTPAAALREVEELWLYERLEPVAYFDAFTFNGTTYYPVLAENSEHLTSRLMWFQLSTGWHEGNGASVALMTTDGDYLEANGALVPKENPLAIGRGFETSYITAINDHRAFFYGRINYPSAVRWELESRVSYSPHWIDDPVPEGTLLNVPITEEWVEKDGVRYFFFTIDTHAVWQQLCDQYNYSTTMYLYDADNTLLDTIDLGEQWTAFRE